MPLLNESLHEYIERRQRARDTLLPKPEAQAPQQEKIALQRVDGRPDEPRARTLLRSMVEALDRGDSDTYWKCWEMLIALHLEMAEPSDKVRHGE